MKIHGRWGAFTPRPEQRAAYAKRAEREAKQRREAIAQQRAWLEKHQTCANGCGQPVAFYDQINYTLRHGGCCSAECEAALEAAPAAEKPVSGKKR